MRRNAPATSDDEASVTVGQNRAAGLTTLKVHCYACPRDLIVSIEGFPDEMLLDDLCRRFRCSGCGSRKTVSARRDMHAHYAKTYAGPGAHRPISPLPDHYTVHFLRGPRAGTFVTGDAASQAASVTDAAGKPTRGRP